MSIKADTRNVSKKYQQIFLLDAIFFVSANLAKYIYHQWNQNIS